jgi:hypothetical protein
MLGPLVLIAVALSALAALIRRLTQRRPAHAVIVSPPKSTVIARDGAVRSVQSARLTLTKADFDRIWTPANLENLARTYWLFLTRVTLGLIRIVYGSDSRSVVFVSEPITLLRFEAPEYTIEDGHRGVKWHIRDGAARHP